MNMPFLMIFMVSFVTSTGPMERDQKPIIEQEYIESERVCCACQDSLIDQQCHFQYDPDHLVCIRCYYYKTPLHEINLDHVSHEPLPHNNA